MPLPGFEPGSQPPRGCILSRLDYRSSLLDLQKLYKYLSFTIIKMKEITCNSCKKKVMNNIGCVIFKCPSCGKEDIVRCKECRVLAIKYVCSCGFTGPN